MKAITWTCDRCRIKVEAPYETLIVEEYGPMAIRSGFPPQEPAAWEMFSDDESVVDVCGGCLTDEERADRVLCEVEADAMFREPGDEWWTS